MFETSPLQFGTPVSNIQGAMANGLRQNRRVFLQQSGVGLGAIAATALGMPQGLLQGAPAEQQDFRIPATAKRIIYLFQSGAPSQFESFDYKPELKKLAKTELPDSVRNGQRLTGMTSGQASFPIAPSKFDFRQHGDSGQWISDLFPNVGRIADKICVVRSMHTEAINHDPAITFFQTGSQLPGRPSMGAWVAYGLGTLNENLPSYMVLLSRGTGRAAGQPLYDRLWGTGVLPGQYQGVKLRSGSDPILYLANPAGCPPEVRRRMLDQLKSLNQGSFEQYHDPQIATRIEQYELAFRMQSAVPDLMDLSSETAETLERYGPEVNKPGTFARNCLLARRLAERDVRFIQLFHMGWDQHDQLPAHMSKQCYDTDQPTAALIEDLEQRGLLDDTIVIWGGEFGRTVYCQGQLTEETYGRDHHPRSFSIFMAGGGIKPGLTYGKTDDFGYNIVEGPVHVNDLHATLLHSLGIDHTKLTTPFQGLDLRLSGVEERKVIHDILS